MRSLKSKKKNKLGVIDIFAGPGGLGEGFSSFNSDGSHPFEIAVSAEMEKSAHATLRFRAFYRLILRQEGKVPKDYYSFLENFVNGSALPPETHFGIGKWKELWMKAEEEALNLTLGVSVDNNVLFEKISKVKDTFDEMILIGGPPCQAYSIVGRSRQKKVKAFSSKGTAKHFLYKQYLEILAKFSPAVFIMENVKGILTSKVGNEDMFSAIMQDLANPSATLPRYLKQGNKSERYVLLPIHLEEGEERTLDLITKKPSSFIIRCENHGIPQARHRVIIMGVREDLMHPSVANVLGLTVFEQEVTVETALEGIPKLRSGISRKQDDPKAWLQAMESERNRIVKIIEKTMPDVAKKLKINNPAFKLPRTDKIYNGSMNSFTKKLKSSKQNVVLNHDARGHMQSDLGRYMFCAAFAEVYKRSPSSEEFPKQLAPDHKNWKTGAFADRFRVQRRDRPSNTVTSHLSKDGHAFIHWDSRQCRSLTVREAARLQTFPDDYLFLGNRTQQYVQVGNAVPPQIAREIAKVVWSIISK